MKVKMERCTVTAVTLKTRTHTETCTGAHGLRSPLDDVQREFPWKPLPDPRLRAGGSWRGVEQLQQLDFTLKLLAQERTNTQVLHVYLGFHGNSFLMFSHDAKDPIRTLKVL